MEVTYKSILSWFEIYFEDVNRYQGSPEDVLNLKKYFTNNFKFIMYTAPPFIKSPLTREELLILFVHPGLYEKLSPQYYVVDVAQMIVVVQFELQFIDLSSGKTWPPKQASAHYQLTVDNDKDLKIEQIMYWTQSSAPEVMDSMYSLWTESREKALTDLATGFIEHENDFNSKHSY